VSASPRVCVSDRVSRRALGLRKRGRCLELERERLLADQPARVSPSAVPFEAARRTFLLRGLLDELPVEAEAMRTILGWSREEIARTSGVPLNTVRSRLRLAKEALRRKIGGEACSAGCAEKRTLVQGSLD